MIDKILSPVPYEIEVEQLRAQIADMREAAAFLQRKYLQAMLRLSKANALLPPEQRQ